MANCRLKPFHVKLLGIRRVPWGGTPADAPLEAELQQRGLFQDIHHMAGQADLIVLTCSLTDITCGMVDSAFLKACKPGVRIINVARGVCRCVELVLLLAAFRTVPAGSLMALLQGPLNVVLTACTPLRQHRAVFSGCN